MTYQPPGGQQPDGTPSYAQPQDPWAGGYELGVASVPTDPIPQHYDPYGPVSPSEVWSQQTVMQGGQYGYAAPPQKRTGLFVMVFLLIVVLGGGGGYAAWYFIAHGANNDPPVSPTTAASTDPTTGSTTPGGPQFVANCPISSKAGAFDPCAVEKGDCLVNRGTDDLPDIQTATCSTPGSFEILKVSRGPDIKEGPGDKFDKDVTSRAECADTGFNVWYGYQDAFDDDKDVFLCLKRTDT